MSSILPYLVVGISSGSVYGLAGMGLVVTYKTTGVFNFAHGAVATASAYLFFELWVRQGWPWPVGAILSIAVISTVGGLAMERLGRRLAEAPLAIGVVATVGLTLGVEGVVIALFGAPAINFPSFLPVRAFHVAGVYVGSDQIIFVAVTLAVAAALFVFFRRSRLGLAMQGAVDNPELLGLTGTSPAKVRSWAWIIGFAMAALAGVLLGPNYGLNAQLLTLLVVQAFGAAAIGAFRSLPLTYVGGLILGIGSAFSTRYVTHIPALEGLPPSLPFVLLFGVLVAVPGRLRTQTSRTISAIAVRSRGDQRVALSASLGAVAVAAVVPFVVGTRLPVYTDSAIYVIVFASLALLVRTSGQVSLCHAAFAAVGAASFSHFAHGLHIPWLLALVFAGLVAVPIGAIVAIPAIRLSGLYLALATYGFGVLLEDLFYYRRIMFGDTGPITVPRPGVLDMAGDRGFYYVCLAIAVVACLLVATVQHSRLGRLLRGLSQSPTGLVSLGANINVTLVLVFCIAAFLAGVAGGLFGALTGSTSGSTSFTDTSSLLWVALLYLAGKGELRAAVIAALLIGVVPDYLGSSSNIASAYEPIAFGVGAVGVALASTGTNVDLKLIIRRLSMAAEDRRRHSPVAARLIERVEPG